jgi:hypothetical protein
MIIDRGSCAKVVSTTLVRNLNLNTMKHPKPYRLQWLNKCGKVKVTEQVLISFVIGRYSDDVMCDVVLKHISHLLLGCFWQFDKRVIHDGFRNKYTIVKDENHHSYTSISKKKMYND